MHPTTPPSSEHDALRAEISRRGITRLIHFTTLDNLLGICQHGGILSRTKLRSLNLENPDLHLTHFLEINDSLRLDSLPDRINLSIQHPNHYLLNRFKSVHAARDDHWCVITLDPLLLLRPDALFSVHNAASARAKAAGIQGGIRGFLALFAETMTVNTPQGEIQLNRKGRAACHPTDVQAEVLLKDRVPTAHIISIAFDSAEPLDIARRALRTLGVNAPAMVVDPSLFRDRT